MAAKLASDSPQLKKAKAPLKVTTFAWDGTHEKPDGGHSSPQFPSRSRQIERSLAQASLRREQARNPAKGSIPQTDAPAAYNPGTYGGAVRSSAAPPGALPTQPSARGGASPLSRDEQLQVAELEAEVTALRKKAAELKRAQQQASAPAAGTSTGATVRRAVDPPTGGAHAGAVVPARAWERAPGLGGAAASGVTSSPHGDVRRRPLQAATMQPAASPREGGENLPSSYVRFLEKRLQLLAEDLGGYASLDTRQAAGDERGAHLADGTGADGRSLASSAAEDTGRGHGGGRTALDAGTGGLFASSERVAWRQEGDPAGVVATDRDVRFNGGRHHVGGRRRQEDDYRRRHDGDEDDDSDPDVDEKENRERGGQGDAWRGDGGSISVPSWPYSSQAGVSRFNMGLAEYERATGMVRSASACELRWEDTMFGRRERVGGGVEQGAGSDQDNDGGDDGDEYDDYGYVSDSMAGRQGGTSTQYRPHSAAVGAARGGGGVGGQDGSRDSSQPTRTSGSSYSYLTAGHHWFGGHHGQCARRLSRPKKPTVPRSFSFEARERRRKKTILQMRLEQDLALQRERERGDMNQRFQASALPVSALEPRYQQLREEEETRRQMRKHARQELLEAYAQPFSLYYRTTAAREAAVKATKGIRAELREWQKQRTFVHHPVPRSTKEQRFQQLQQLQEERKALRQLRAMQALQGMQLPPAVERLAADGKESAAKKRAAPLLLQPNCTFAPKVKTTVPDFQKLHAAWDDTLATMRGSARKTEFQEFALETEKINAAESQRRIQQDMAADAQLLTEERWPFMSTRAKVRPAAVPAFPAPTKPIRETKASRSARMATLQGFEKGAFLTRAQKEEIANQKLEKAREVRRKVWEVARLQHAQRHGGTEDLVSDAGAAGAPGASTIPKEIAPQLHVQARYQQQEERARQMVEQALLANNVPLDIILGQPE